MVVVTHSLSFVNGSECSIHFHNDMCTYVVCKQTVVQPYQERWWHKQKWYKKQTDKTTHKLYWLEDYVLLVCRGVDGEMLMEKGLPGMGASDHTTSMT